MNTLSSHPLLIAIGGRVGTGKTTLVYALKKAEPRLATAEILDGDEVRRELLGYDLRYTMQDEDYTPEVTARVVAAMKGRAAELIGQGISILQPSGFFAPEDRADVQSFARANGARFVGLWLHAPDDVVVARLNKRLEERAGLSVLDQEKGHASDACPAVLLKFGHLLPPSPDDPVWHAVDATQDMQAIVAQAQAFVTLIS